MLGPALRHDLTEIAGLDFLSSPTGAILEAQQLAASAWRADATYFLVNGCTAGIHAAVMATCRPGTSLVLPRNCHLSAYNAAVLTGCTPSWLAPPYDPVYQVAHAVTPAQVAAHLQAVAQPPAAVMVVSPTYYGVACDVRGLAEVCHAHDTPLLVDAAHGAHFGLHAALPGSALDCGADIVVHSTHKVLTSLTQSAMLHVQGGRVSRRRVEQALQLLQSSSPSYLLMASLDAAQAQVHDPTLFDGPVAAALRIREGLAALPRVDTLDARSTGLPDNRVDPLRICFAARDRCMTGFEMGAILEQQHGIVPELCTQRLVVLALGPGSSVPDADRLVSAMREMLPGSLAASDGPKALKTAGQVSREGDEQVPTAMGPRESFFAESELVDVGACVGRISADILCPYPPGIPAIVPGEVFTARVLGGLLSVVEAGGFVSGASDATLKRIRVIVTSSE